MDMRNHLRAEYTPFDCERATRAVRSCGGSRAGGGSRKLFECWLVGWRCRVLHVGVESHLVQRADLTLSERTAHLALSLWPHSSLPHLTINLSCRLDQRVDHHLSFSHFFHPASYLFRSTFIYPWVPHHHAFRLHHYYNPQERRRGKSQR